MAFIYACTLYPVHIQINIIFHVVSLLICISSSIVFIYVCTLLMYAHCVLCTF